MMMVVDGVVDDGDDGVVDVDGGVDGVVDDDGVVIGLLLMIIEPNKSHPK